MKTRLWATGAAAACLALPAPALAGKPTNVDRTNAAKECKAERGTTDATREAFALKYGTKSSKRKNAFGKCVSRHAKKRMKKTGRADRKEIKRGHDKARDKKHRA